VGHLPLAPATLISHQRKKKAKRAYLHTTALGGGWEGAANGKKTAKIIKAKPQEGKSTP